MKQTITGPAMPTATICINKSRLKVYNNESDPTYYMEKGQEFQIELFNPTSNSILAKIYLNSKQISQGGLVLRPGERVFLERYLDVAKRFKFDVYEVSNTKEVQKAIQDNGDFKVEFYNEQTLNLYSSSGTLVINNPTYTRWGGTGGNPYYFDGSVSTYTSGISLTGGIQGGTSYSSNINTSSFNAASSIGSTLTTTDNLSGTLSDTLRSRSRQPIKKLKSIETGRVEAGSNSSQQLQTVDKQFSYYAFHTVECKLLPISQKVNTSEDINIKRYCTKCGHKTSKTDKFCSACGNKV
jgi:hypothetical protein